MSTNWVKVYRYITARIIQIENNGEKHSSKEELEFIQKYMESLGGE